MKKDSIIVHCDESKLNPIWLVELACRNKKDFPEFIRRKKIKSFSNKNDALFFSVEYSKGLENPLIVYECSPWWNREYFNPIK